MVMFSSAKIVLPDNKPRGAGGGGTLNFSAYVGSGPASTLYPKKISGISSNPLKKF